MLLSIGLHGPAGMPPAFSPWGIVSKFYSTFFFLYQPLCAQVAADAPKDSVRGVVLLNAAGAMNNKVRSDTNQT